MRDFLHLPSQVMDRPVLLDRMEPSWETGNHQTLAERLGMNSTVAPPLLERLDTTNGTIPILLQRLDMTEVPGTNHPGFNPHQVTMRTPMEMSYLEMKNGVPKTNASSTWTTSLKPSDERRSRNSKHFPKSYQSSILTH